MPSKKFSQPYFRIELNFSILEAKALHPVEYPEFLKEGGTRSVSVQFQSEEQTILYFVHFLKRQILKGEGHGTVAPPKYASGH